MTLATHYDLSTGSTTARDDSARVVGTLTTRLTDAVARSRSALDAHGALLPPGTLAQADALLAELSRHRVCIALYGEVKAGKSTLLNAIAGAPLSPVAFEPLTSVPLRVTYGEETVWHVGDRQLGSVDAVEALMRNGTELDTEVEVRTDLDLLELGGAVDLLDTPGVGSDAHFDAISTAALSSLDAVVLVVRYPALFTQFTRRIMEGLEADIGKLFVVWNLDADCAELTADERSRHAETLRANIAGAHDLFLVDARAGFRAMQAEDAAGSIASGVSALIAALRRFATSGDRGVTALREAAKRANALLRTAHQTLAQRQATLDAALQEARGRIHGVRAAADAESAAAREQLAGRESTLTRIREQSASAAGTLAADLRRQLRSARRRWAFRGDLPTLETSVGAALRCYADAVDTANREASGAVLAETAQFGAPLREAAYPAAQPAPAALAPDDRARRAASGYLQTLRRGLWPRWYLPGLAELDRTVIEENLNTQAAWLNAYVADAHAAAAATLAARLDGVNQRAQAEIQRIQHETNFTASEAELAQLNRHVPALAVQVQVAARTTDEAGVLLA